MSQLTIKFKFFRAVRIKIFFKCVAAAWTVRSKIDAEFSQHAVLPVGGVAVKGGVKKCGITYIFHTVADADAFKLCGARKSVNAD